MTNVTRVPLARATPTPHLRGVLPPSPQLPHAADPAGSAAAARPGSWWRGALLVVALWSAWGVMTAAQQWATRAPGDTAAPFARLVLAHLLEAWVWSALTPVVALLVRRWPVSRDGWLRAVPLHLLAALALAAAERVALRALLPWSSPFDDVSLLPFAQSFLRSLPSNLLRYLAVVALVHAVELARRLRARELDAARLAAQLSDAQLRALRAQLHPHFLFNALHSASMLALYEPRSAHQVLVQLSALLRRALGGADRHEVPLREELDFLERYLAIEQVRFGERLHARFEVDDAALAALVPTLVLQPLVENALRHGVDPRPDGGEVTVRARGAGGWLELEVEDDGPGPPRSDAPVREEGSGVGLANLRARLHTAYGAAQDVELACGPRGGTLARVRVPLRLADDAPASAVLVPPAETVA